MHGEGIEPSTDSWFRTTYESLGLISGDWRLIRVVIIHIPFVEIVGAFCSGFRGSRFLAIVVQSSLTVSASENAVVSICAVFATS
jgi:hypothetical protein